ncbi:TPA_asm: MC092R [Molluscum contagiosum virus]|nr:TPA_asm: MC092R [Molluscum contagiosum virus]
MDVYVVRDGAYPRVAARGDATAFVLLGEHVPFVQARLREMRERDERVFLAEYALTPDARTLALRARVVSSSAAVHGRPVSAAQFLHAPHAFRLQTVPRELTRSRDAGTLTVHALCVPEHACVRVTAFVHCPPTPPVPADLRLQGERVRDAAFFYSDARLALQMRGTPGARASAFRNAALRAALGAAVRGAAPAPLRELLEALLPPLRAARWLALLPAHDADAVRLARFCYERERFRAFVFAWFCGQLSAQRAENEKISRAYESVARAL